MHKKPTGFTIVELLIVIVVIGILAAITIVAYNGMQQRARTAQITSAVDSWEKIIRMEMAVQDGGNLPTIGVTCLGNSVANFPATGAGMSAGTCIVPSTGNPITYDSTMFSAWKTTSRPSGLLPATKLTFDGLDYNARGVLMQVYDNGAGGRNALLQWFPQTKGACGRGQAYSSIYNDRMPLTYADMCVLGIE